MDEDLAISIKKALTNDETAPKQKHVRNIILYTWDVHGPGSFWLALKAYPSLRDDLVLFKTLVTIHKVIRAGHPLCLKEGIKEKQWIHSLPANPRSSHRNK
jgi:hypothetical protein